MRARTILLVVAILLGLVLIGLALFVATFDANRYKPQLIELVEEQTGRRLELPGKLSLSLWPGLALESGPAALSGPGGKGQAMRFDSGRVSMALAPLLSRELIIDGITLSGVQIDSSVDGKGWRIEQGVLAADRIASGESGRLEFDARLRSPDGRTDMALKVLASYVPDFATRRVQFDSVDAVLDGAGAGFADLKARIGGTLLADFAAGLYDARALAINATPAAGPALKLAGSGRFAAVESTARLALDGTLDDAKLRLSATANRLDPLELEYEMSADRIDVDRLREQTARSAQAGPAGTPAAASEPAPTTVVPPSAPAATPATTPGGDQATARGGIAAIAAVDTRGTLKIGELRVSGLRLTRLDATLDSGQGRVLVDPAAGQLNGGALQGTLQLSEAGHRLVAKLSGVDAGGLIRDATGRDVLDGSGDFALDLGTAPADTSDALVRSLSGRASLALTNGAVKGIDVDRLIRQVREALAGQLPVERGAQAGERTPFASLNGRFRIADGIARSDDVDLRADWMRARASGQIDLGARSLDWVVRTTITGTPGGDPDPARRDTFDRMRGLTVPIRLSGSWGDPRYRVDVQDLATGVLKNEIERRLGERLGLTPEPGAGAGSAPREQPKPLELLRDLLKR